MLGITIVTILIAAIFICLIKLQQRLNLKKQNEYDLFFIADEECPLTTQTILAREPSQDSLQSVPSYNKAILNTIPVNINAALKMVSCILIKSLKKHKNTNLKNESKVNVVFVKNTKLI